MITVGTGPCKTCQRTADDIPLTGETKQADDGGTWWRVQEGITCAWCGQKFDWMHEAPIVLDMPARCRNVQLAERFNLG